MPINPSIALGIQPLKVEDPMNKFANMMQIENAGNQNALAQYQLKAAQRGDAAVNSLNEGYKATGGDINKLTQYLIQQGQGSQVPAVTKTSAESQKAVSEAIVKKMEILRERYGQINPNSPNAPAEYLAISADAHNDPYIGPSVAKAGASMEKTIAEVKQALANGTFAEMIDRTKMSAKDYVDAHKLQLTSQDMGGSMRVIGTDTVTGKSQEIGGSRVGKTATPGEQLAHDDRAKGNGIQLSDVEQAALDRAVAENRIDPYRINSRNARILANTLLANPEADLSAISGDSSLKRNAQFQQKVMMASALPEIMTNMVNAGKKLNYSDVKAVGMMQAWVNGQTNDPDVTSYMVQRNDALMSIANVMRGIGMTDQAHRAETEVTSPAMSPKALDAWLSAQMTALKPRLKNMGKHAIDEVPTELPGGDGATTAGAAPEGVDAAIWGVMTPEERALWAK